jgi:hypothetical protein
MALIPVSRPRSFFHSTEGVAAITGRLTSRLPNAREAYLASVEENDEADQDTFEIRHKDLPIRTNKEMLKKAIKYDEAQLTKFNDITKKLREYQLPSCSTQNLSHRDHQPHDIQSSI